MNIFDKNLTLLYVEDDKEILEETSNTLKLFKLTVLTAKNGQEGFELFLKHRNEINLILTDIKMPILNGIDMIKEIRQKDWEIPIIITSAHQEIDFFKQSISLNVNEYILKPIDIFKLKDAIEKSMEPILLKKELIQKNIILQKEIEKNNEQHKMLLTQSRFAAMGEMINMIAHQWRQPLASIGTAAYKINLKLQMNSFDLSKQEEQKKLKEFTKTNLDNIEEYVQNLTNTIDDFKNFYKSDKETRNINISEIIKKTLNITKKMFLDNKIEVEEIYKNTNNSKIYENELTHVFINILKNAYDNFKEKNIENAKIKIEIKDFEDGVIINFTDNGKGVKEEYLERIFEPYFSTKNEKNGTGLGLYMSKIIITKNHQGQINAQNTKDGLSITITLV